MMVVRYMFQNITNISHKKHKRHLLQDRIRISTLHASIGYWADVLRIDAVRAAGLPTEVKYRVARLDNSKN